MTFHYDVIIIGGGHAGCEAAAASARLGAKTCLVTMDMNKIAQMSCNPAVGGIAKGQIVREIDALGGQMGLVTDATAIQFRMLNRGKGPAVWSPRAQCDREKFIWKWRETLDHTPNLDIWQDQADELLVEAGEAVGIRTIWGVELRAKSIVVTAGTFLNGLMHVGRRMVPGGRIAEPAVPHFTESITRWGIRTDRMKTGTPVRIDRRSVHFEELEEQPGEQDFHQFSYMGEPRLLPQLPCWLLNTNSRVHEILRSGLADSPLYNGQIQSIGPRYCPSIETKLVTFPDREQHPLFLEPEGTDTNEMYLNGFSSSMPVEIQLEALRQIPALRDVRVYRPGYAIEYDFFDPTQLNHSMESRILSGLFFAGQVNGTTGYEEAAGQGLIAGINAALHAGSPKTSLHANSQQAPSLHAAPQQASSLRPSPLQAPSSLAQSPVCCDPVATPSCQVGCATSAAKAPFLLARDEAYIGVLIDDLATKGVDEPYRMFTSRAEYRILLRQDDADTRLTERSYHLGLATRERYDWWLQKKENIDRILHFCENTPVKPRDINGALEALGTTPLQFGCKVADLIARPQLSIEKLSEIIPELKAAVEASPNRREEIAEAAEINIKYRGYIEREKLVADKMHRLENIRIRGRFNYESLHELSTEARQKLQRIDPETLAQASRIPGVSPSDINVLLVLLGR